MAHTPHTLARFSRRLVITLSLTAAITLGVRGTALAQVPPPINGFTGTMATEGSIDAVDVAARTVIVKTEDGVRHVFHAARTLLVHGGPGMNSLKDLKPGVSVAIHYSLVGEEATAEEIDHIGDGGLQTAEGIVTRVDRGRREITIQLEDGTTELLKLTEHAAAGASKELDRSVGTSTRIIVFYTNDAGKKVVHFFRKASEG